MSKYSKKWLRNLYWTLENITDRNKRKSKEQKKYIVIFSWSRRFNVA